MDLNVDKQNYIYPTSIGIEKFDSQCGWLKSLLDFSQMTKTVLSR